MQPAADLLDKAATVRKNNNSNKNQTSAQLPDKGRDRGDATWSVVNTTTTDFYCLLVFNRALGDTGLALVNIIWLPNYTIPSDVAWPSPLALTFPLLTLPPEARTYVCSNLSSNWLWQDCLCWACRCIRGTYTFGCLNKPNTQYRIKLWFFCPKLKYRIKLWSFAQYSSTTKHNEVKRCVQTDDYISSVFRVAGWMNASNPSARCLRVRQHCLLLMTARQWSRLVLETEMLGQPETCFLWKTYWCKCVDP